MIKNFEGFRLHVLARPALQERLSAVADRAAFVALVVETGQAEGYAFGADEVRLAMADGHRAWLERWL